MAQLKTATVDGKRIAYSSETVFLIQEGYGKKGSYKTKWSFTGDLQKAVFYYQSLNIGCGYKKRFFVPSFNKPVLARHFS